jgi:hypothetical protein
MIAPPVPSRRLQGPPHALQRMRGLAEMAWNMSIARPHFLHSYVYVGTPSYSTFQGRFAIPLRQQTDDPEETRTLSVSRHICKNGMVSCGPPYHPDAAPPASFAHPTGI